jgi:hypothetical protein
MATYYSSWTSVNNACIALRMKIVTSYSQSVSNNTSTVTVKQYIERKNYIDYIGGGSPSGYTSNHKLYFGGTYTSSSEKSWSSNGTTLIQSKTKTISHNANGEGSFTIGGSCSAEILSDYGYGVSASLKISNRTIALPKINRTSSISSNATSNTKFGDTVTFSISRYNSNFTHNLSYKMYNASGTIATGVGTSQSWTIPASLITSTPDNAQPTITITCTTYNGSTYIGSSTHSFKCKVPDTYQPTCSLALEDVGLVPDTWNIWVKGKSAIKGTITASGSGGSTIKSYVSKANDEIFSVNPFTTNYLKYSGERTVTSTVTDSRGRSVSDSKTIEIIDYLPPTISMCKIERCNADGTLNEEGTYGKATVQYKISPVNNLNDKILKVFYGTSAKEVTLTDYEGTYTFTELFYGLETNASYNFEFKVKDTFEEIPQTYTLPPSFVTISKLAGGKGVTFGQVATEEGLISHMDIKLYKNNWMKNVSVDGLKTEKYQGGWITYAEDEA